MILTPDLCGHMKPLGCKGELDAHEGNPENGRAIGLKRSETIPFV